MGQNEIMSDDPNKREIKSNKKEKSDDEDKKKVVYICCTIM